MSYIRLINAVHSLNEQKKALEEMFNLFPDAHFEPGCNSFNSRSYSSFNVNVPFQDFVLIAQRHIVTTKDRLLDFGRPKVVGPSWHIWNDFVGVKLYWYGKYNYYHTDLFRPFKRQGISQSISLRSVEYRQGLCHWKSSYKKLLNLLNKSPNKELIKSYKKQIEEINKEVLKWEIALKEASKIDLNGKSTGGKK